MNEIESAREIAKTAQSLFRRGYSFGTAGNISVRVGERILVSPTNSSFEDLTEHTLSVVDLTGKPLEGPAPSKETHFHIALYEQRPEIKAVVHLHSTYATAVSCLPVTDPTTRCRFSRRTLLCGYHVCRSCPTSALAILGLPIRSDKQLVSRRRCSSRIMARSRPAKRSARPPLSPRSWRNRLSSISCCVAPAKF